MPVPAPSEEESSSANSPVLGYGSYSALSMALGFLFLGHGQRTFKGTIEAGKGKGQGGGGEIITWLLVS